MNPKNSSYTGFIVHDFHKKIGGRSMLFLSGQLENGETFAITEDRFQARFYIRGSDRPAFDELERRLPYSSSCCIEETSFRTMDGEACLRLFFNTIEDARLMDEVLREKGIRTYEADFSLEDQFRIDREVHGSIKISGQAEAANTVDKIFQNPEITNGSWEGKLSLLSMDIETEAGTNKILAIGVYHRDPFTDLKTETILFLGPELSDPRVRSFRSEGELLAAFNKLITDLDPDLITGWNVIDFDLQIIAMRCEALGLSFLPARSKDKSRYLWGGEGRRNSVICPGRQVLDGVRLVRASPYRFEDNSLETVAQTVLGRGKKIEVQTSTEKLAELARLYKKEPEAFCIYCLNDARLVTEILSETGLLRLTLKRSELIGIGLNKAWTSIAAFEHIYTEALHRRAMVAPTMGVDALPFGEAPGGAILEPHPGLHENVMVFDFRSLYPSVICTFNIDPAAYVPDAEAAQHRSSGDSAADEYSVGGPATGAEGPTSGENLIRAPNGACFQREPAILPSLLEQFFEGRAEAKKQGDEIASFVYKIILNSFYGVLGSPGCRFGGEALAGAITSFGQYILHWSKDFYEQKGYTVLYGDTDSVFVRSGMPAECSARELAAKADSLCKELSEALGIHINEKYGRESLLVLEYEKSYRSFFLPTIRGDEKRGEISVQARGRSKGYAGLLASESEEEEQIEIKGMEAVRRDWTELAHNFQRKLLSLLFHKRPEEEVREYIRGSLDELRAGHLDQSLHYIKQLRKPVSAYTRSTPPHVKAAALLPKAEQKGLIRYFMTKNGPEPASTRKSPIDYEHYIQKQLIPIARSLDPAFGFDLTRDLGQGGQLRLF